MLIFRRKKGFHGTTQALLAALLAVYGRHRTDQIPGLGGGAADPGSDGSDAGRKSARRRFAQHLHLRRSYGAVRFGLFGVAYPVTNKYITAVKMPNKKLNVTPDNKTINLFHAGLVLKAPGLSFPSSSSPSKAQKPPRGKARIAKISPSFLVFLCKNV